MSAPRAPIVLDFDGSVLPVAADERRLDLSSWQEDIRFACSWPALRQLADHLAAGTPAGPGDHGCVFLGSGDYHHVTLALLERCADGAAFDLVVCDNHPDNMRYPLGVHCGSWISRACAMPHIRHVHVIGISSADIGVAHAWENRLTPLVRNRLTYWSVGRPTGWIRVFGANRHKDFASPDELMAAFLPCVAAGRRVYLSLDKDVFGPDVVRTNWDQGMFRAEHAERLIAACAGRLVGVDVTGDVSAYAYKGWFKRLLSRLDGQEEPEAAVLPAWQEGQRELNRKIDAWVRAAFPCAGDGGREEIFLI